VRRAAVTALAGALLALAAATGPAGAQSFSEWSLAARVKLALLADPRVTGAYVDHLAVEARDRRVTLWGTVASEDARRAAAATAGAVGGVDAVDDRLVVIPTEALDLLRADRTLAADVRRALRADPRLRRPPGPARIQENLAIHVRVREGVVWLDGRVPDLSARLAASEVARGVPGVRAVVNDLRSVQLALARG